MRTGRIQRGFVLLLTLVLLAVLAVGMVSLSRHSIEAAVSARDAKLDLQRRWMLRSLGDTVLPRAEAILEKRAGSSQSSVGDGDGVVRWELPGLALEEGSKAEGKSDAEVGIAVVVADEAARLNVNAPRWRGDDRGLEAVVRKLMRARGQTATVQVRRPEVGRLAETHQEAPQATQEVGGVTSYEGIFPLATPRELLGVPGGVGLTGSLTLWGEGRVNVCRAPAAVLEAVLGPSWSRGDVRRLVEERERWLQAGGGAGLRLDHLLDGLDLSEPQRQHAQEVLVDSSQVYSLWVVFHDPHRTRYALTVRIGGESHAEETGRKERGEGENPPRPLVRRLVW